MSTDPLSSHPQSAHAKEDLTLKQIDSFIATNEKQPISPDDEDSSQSSSPNANASSSFSNPSSLIQTESENRNEIETANESENENENENENEDVDGSLEDEWEDEEAEENRNQQQSSLPRLLSRASSTSSSSSILSPDADSSSSSSPASSFPRFKKKCKSKKCHLRHRSLNKNSPIRGSYWDSRPNRGPIHRSFSCVGDNCKAARAVDNLPEVMAHDKAAKNQPSDLEVALTSVNNRILSTSYH